MNEGFNFDDAFEIARKTFNYTNHTVLGEALEKWPADLMTQVIPEIYHIIALSPTSARKSLLLRACMRIQRLRCALSTVMLFIWQDLQHTHQHM